MGPGDVDLPEDAALSADEEGYEPAADETDPFAAAADDLLPEDHDWHVGHHHRRLMRMLHDAVAMHIAVGDFLASSELEIAMANVKAELDWD